jgi:hypothetical protein
MKNKEILEEKWNYSLTFYVLTQIIIFNVLFLPRK